MKRFSLVLACALMLAGSGCCWMHQPYGCGYGGAPMGGGCPNGACGAGGYPGAMPYGGAYAPTGGTAYNNPYMTATLDPLPAL